MPMYFTLLSMHKISTKLFPTGLYYKIKYPLIKDAIINFQIDKKLTISD